MVEAVLAILEGKVDKVQRSLEAKMHAAAEALAFEQAALLRDQLKALASTTEHQVVAARIALEQVLERLAHHRFAVHAADLAQAREFVEVLVDEQFRHGVSCAVTTAALLR